MEPMKLERGDVVQISIDNEPLFAGCFMMVTDPKSWGAQGFISMPKDKSTFPGQAYYRCQWADMEFVGKAHFVPGE
jgi:hypothetical protein